MPATFTVGGTLSTWANSNPLGLSGETGLNSPTGLIGSRPYQPGSGGFARALDQADADAIQNLTGVVTNHGLYQDITNFVSALSASYGPQTVGALTQSATNGQLNAVLSPRALVCAVRDACNFMLNNAPTMGR